MNFIAIIVVLILSVNSCFLVFACMLSSQMREEEACIYYGEEIADKPSTPLINFRPLPEAG